MISKERREYLRTYQKAWVKEARWDWLAKNGPCRQCGSSERLEVDHIDPSLKVSHAVWSWSKPRREAELAKCQVLCHDCHAKKTGHQNRLRQTGKPGRPSKLTEETAREIFALKGHVGSREVARRFGIHHATVHNIWRGKIWGWATNPNPQLQLIAKDAAA